LAYGLLHPPSIVLTFFVLVGLQSVGHFAVNFKIYYRPRVRISVPPSRAREARPEGDVFGI